MTRIKGVASDYYYGHKISDYGIENGYVDYRTFAAAFDAVMANNLMSDTEGVIGYWEQVGGFCDNSYAIEQIEEQIEELEEQIEELEDKIAVLEEDQEELSDNLFAETEKEIQIYKSDVEHLEKKKDVLEDEKTELEEEQDNLPEVYQWFIVGDNAVSILEENNEIVFYNDTLDLYLWGVTHWGTSWDFVLTNIPCMMGDKAYEM